LGQQVASFVSRPDLSPPTVTVDRRGRDFVPGSGAPRFILMAPKGYTASGPGQQGLMILDTDGHLVWFQPLPGSSSSPMDFSVQTYRGQQVLTWWQGTVKSGVGYGSCVIADASYRRIATVQAGNGLQADLHDFRLTPQNTALITAFRTAAADLSALGGPRNGKVLSGVAQEIDVATGKVLFEWDSLRHVGVTETYLNLPGGKQAAPFDYFHINSVGLAPDGDLIISARNTWAVYKVDRHSGQVRWRLNGKRSDFAMGPGAKFYWQHDARLHPNGTLSVFDDGASPPEEPRSRAIILGLDTTRRRATLLHQYTHPAGLLAANQGNTQLLPGGRVFVGWGNQPYFSEFLADGSLILDGRLPANDQSYRSYTFNWVGHPSEPPTIALGPNPTGSKTVYVSWNGATELRSWRVLAGPDPSSLTPVATARRNGFETAISVNEKGPSFVAVALDRNGKELGRSLPAQA
jgi:hypothetical protein